MIRTNVFPYLSERINKLKNRRTCVEKETKKSVFSIEPMPCNCGRKRQMGSSVELDSPLLVQEPAEWGPTLWKYLHVLAERLGTSGSPIVDTDQATYMESILSTLPLILPCMDCQAHATSYLSQHPLPALKGLYQDHLRQTVRIWLFTFHQAVRAQKEQPPLLSTSEECAHLYQGGVLSKADYNRFVQTVVSAVRQGWVRMDHWRKWFSHSEKLRILSGNVVI
jgi:hypothetical protein